MEGLRADERWDKRLSTQRRRVPSRMFGIGSGEEGESEQAPIGRLAVPANATNPSLLRVNKSVGATKRSNIHRGVFFPQPKKLNLFVFGSGGTRINL